jgi:hypothetical protein
VWKKLKLKWGLESDFHVFIILVVFAATGTTVVAIKGLFFQMLGFESEGSNLVKTILYLIFIFPAYQALLLLYGFLFGQFTFFWNKEKMLAQRVLGIFKKKTRDTSGDLKS